MAMVCPSCSHVNDGASAFCVNCGASLRPSAQAATPQPRAADSRSVTINLQVPKQLEVGIDYLKKLDPSQRWCLVSAIAAALSGFLPWGGAVGFYGAGSQSIFGLSGRLYAVLVVLLAAVVGLRMLASRLKTGLAAHFSAAALLVSFFIFLVSAVGILFMSYAGDMFGSYVRVDFGAYALSASSCALFVSCYRAVVRAMNNVR